METDESRPTAGAGEGLDLDRVLAAIGDGSRWRILVALAERDNVLVNELAELLGRNASTVSKHLRFLREAGLVEAGRGRLYRIAPQLALDREKGELDLGFAVLRFHPAG